MSFTTDLRKLADLSLYAPSREVGSRWGQILRENPDLRRFMLTAREVGLLELIS